MYCTHSRSAVKLKAFIVECMSFHKVWLKPTNVAFSTGQLQASHLRRCLDGAFCQAPHFSESQTHQWYIFTGDLQVSRSANSQAHQCYIFKQGICENVIPQSLKFTHATFSTEVLQTSISFQTLSLKPIDVSTGSSQAPDPIKAQTHRCYLFNKGFASISIFHEVSEPLHDVVSTRNLQAHLPV